MAGRKPFVTTDEQRRLARAMAGFGGPQDDVARVVRCSPPTLRKCFRHELDVATIEANARGAQCLFQQATTPGNIAASIVWLMARAGWRQKHAVEVTGQDGQPLRSAQVVIRRLAEPQDQDRPAKLIEGERT